MKNNSQYYNKEAVNTPNVRKNLFKIFLWKFLDLYGSLMRPFYFLRFPVISSLHFILFFSSVINILFLSDIAAQNALVSARIISLSLGKQSLSF